ncbi:MAG: 2-phospho-L-lactate transferase [Stellaceae bacterium]
MTVRVVALSGGVGGAKLVLGLDRILPPGALLVVANTGDDFEHLGLKISPDLDTLLYALAGLDNEATGWGRRDESWSCMAALEALGGETWFRLGDRDLAMHLERTRRLATGETLSAFAADMARRLGIASRIVPMSDDPVRTRVVTAEGTLDFQDYFVRRRAEPAVRGLDFAGACEARPHPEIIAALADPALQAVVICPSNPFLSIRPIFAVPGILDALRATAAPVIAVSPIINGSAVKGPTAKMMREYGLVPSAETVAHYYTTLLDLDLFAVDRCDAAVAGVSTMVRPLAVDILMRSLDDRIALARGVLAAAEELRR